MTNRKYLATQQLAKHIGISLRESDVHIVRPLEGTTCKHLVVYGVAIREGNQTRLYFYWSSPNHREGMFRSTILHNSHLKVRQHGDATLVGNQVIAW